LTSTSQSPSRLSTAGTGRAGAEPAT
jgi:hypothetical protein